VRERAAPQFVQNLVFASNADPHSTQYFAEETGRGFSRLTASFRLPHRPYSLKSLVLVMNCPKPARSKKSRKALLASRSPTNDSSTQSVYVWLICVCVFAATLPIRQRHSSTAYHVVRLIVTIASSFVVSKSVCVVLMVRASEFEPSSFVGRKSVCVCARTTRPGGI
jgi:hypothetical protein